MSKRYPAGILRKTPQTPSQTSAQGVWNMTDVTQAQKTNTWPIAGVPDPMSRSLRFRSSASAYLTRTPATATNQKTWTWSGWVKRGRIDTEQTIFACVAGGTSDATYLQFEFAGATFSTLYMAGYTVNWRATTQLFRDPSAWYHFVFALDTTQATASNRIKLYVNGTQITAFSTSNDPSLNQDLSVNRAAAHNISSRVGYASDNYLDCYLAEVNFIDGQQLTPSSFGGTDQYGVWQARPYTGTYGTNGFYLPFKDPTSTTTLCYDYSGNSNNWTPNNISLTSGTTYDSMVDVPTQWIPYNTTGDVGNTVRANYCVMNPNDQSLCSVSNGNLAVTTNNGGYGGATRGTIGVSSGKWYWETQITANGGSAGQAPVCGIMSTTTPIAQSGWTSYQYYGANGNKQQYTNGSLVTNTGYGSTYTTGDIIGVALDMDAGTLTFYKNNTSQGTAFTGITGTFSPSIADPSTGGTTAINFGQQPFTYTPPSGYKTLNTFNLPASTIQQGNLYMDATTYTGTGSSLSITNTAGFKPDMVWVKSRSIVAGHEVIDSVRGVTNTIYPNLTNAEGSVSSVTAFNSNGFTVGTDTGANTNGATFVGWQWQAGQGTTSSNTNGSITSTVSVNASAGFSVVTFTGTGAAGTIGHGLGVAPSMFIVKSRSATGDWWVYHAYANASPQTGTLWLNLTNGFTSPASYWNNTAPTSSVFSIGTASGLNANGVTQVAYCWAEIAGFSKFGSYTGNGSSDGPFIYTGFRPKLVLCKKSSGTGGWGMIDTSINPYNQATTYLQPNTSNATVGGTSANGMDMLSNGFKIRSSDASFNETNGDTYIYMAFAENPFKNALAR